MTNTGNITEVLDRYIDSLTTLREELSDHQSRAIYQLFESSRDYRNSFAEIPKGSIQPEYAFSADVVDEPGAISIISSILSGKGISIKNIGISHNREHGEGRAADQLLRQGFDGSGVGAFEEIQLHAVRVRLQCMFQT